MPRNILIDPQRLGSANPNIQFSGSMANTIKLEVLTSGSLQFTGVSGSLLSIVDSLSGSLFAVSDVSGLPILETFSDDRVVMGRFGSNALVVTGSFVGIGTSNPATRLHLFSSTADAMTLASAAGTTYIDMKHSTSTTFGYVGNGGMVVGASTSDVALRSISGGVVFATAGGAERMRVDSVGNIGIGTSTPTARLFVSGAVNSSTPTMIVKEGVSSPAGGAALLDVQNSAGTSILLVSGSGTVGISNSNVLYAYSQGMKLDVRGNIGITNGGGIFIGDGTTFYRRLIAQDISPTNVLRVGADTAQFSTLTLSSQNSFDLLALSQGNVGIGSTSPTARFQVSGSATASTPTMIVKEGVVNPTGGVGILNVQNSAGTSILFVSGSGNVGIRQTTPSSYEPGMNNLVVGDPAIASTGITLASSTQSTLSFANGTSGGQKYAGYVQYSHGAGRLDFGSAATTRMSIRSDGNVGIGGTNPVARFEVTGSGAGNGATAHFVNNSGTSLMIIRDNGTVGIGTTNPLLKLDFGTNNTGFFLKANPGSATSVTYTGHAHNDMLMGAFLDVATYPNHVISFGHIADSARKFHIGSASDANFNASTTFVPTMTFTAGNNVGIGTTTPGARFEVTGSSSSSGAATISAKNSSGTSLMYVRNDGKIGIGTTTFSSTDTTTTLEVSGSVYIQQNVDNDIKKLQFISSVSNTALASFESKRLASYGSEFRLLIGRSAGGTGAQNVWKTRIYDDPTLYPNQNTHTTFNMTDTGGSNSNGVDITSVVYIGNGSNSNNTRPSLYTTNDAFLAVSRGGVGIGTTVTNGNVLSVTGSTAITGSVLPGIDNTYDLGSASKRWANIYAANFSPTSVTAQLTGSNLVNGMVLFAGATGGITGSQSQFFWDNSNNRLGIGTSSPTSTVDISGLQTNTGANSADSPTGTLRLNYAGQPTPGFGPSIVFSQQWFSGAPTSFVATGQIAGIKTNSGGSYGGGLAFFYGPNGSTSLSEGMRINGSGNVGIGTTNPDARLTLSGSSDLATFYNSSGTKQLTIQNSGDLSFNTSTTLGLVWGNASLKFNGQLAGIQVTPFASSYVSFTVSGRSGQTYALQTWQNSAGNVLGLVDANGSVGLGITTITSPLTSRLIVSGSSAPSDQTMLVKAGTATQTGPVFEVEDYLGNTLLVVSSSGGAVGIGTTLPQAKFHVVSSTAPNGANLYVGYAGSNNYYDANTHHFRDGGSNTRFTINSNGNIVPSADNVSDLGSTSLRWRNVFATNISGSLTGSNLTAGQVVVAGTGGLLSGTNQFTWDNTNSRVGIGTATPSYAIDARVPGNTIANLGGVGLGGALYFGNGASQINHGNNEFGFYTLQSKGITFNPNNTFAMSIVPAGRVGIGGTNPLARFEVTGSGSGAGATMHLLNSSNTSLMYVRDDGYVGIGTNTPTASEKLSVIGSMMVGQGTANTSATYLHLTSGGGSYDALIDFGYYTTFDASLWQIGRNGATGQFQINDTSSGFSNNALAVTVTTRNVGIGTTSILARLHVSGSSTATTPTLLVRHGILDGSNLPVMNIQDAGGNSLLFVSGGGPVGIGTTVISPWNPIFRTLQVGSPGYFSVSAQTTAGSAGSILWNAYGTGDESFAYSVGGGDRATRYRQQYDFRWYVAGPSGATGSPVTFAESMRLDSSGNLNVGTSVSNGNRVAISGGNLSVSGSILPGDNAATNGYDLGSTTYRWRDLYARTGSFSGDVSITGNLTVLGTQTIVNSDVVNIKDNIILLNAGPSPLSTGGIYVADTNPTAQTGSFIWDTSLNQWKAGLAGSEVALPTGTGTSGMVARWTGTNTLSTGVLYDNATNVGVGAASDGTKLYVRYDNASSYTSTGFNTATLHLRNGTGASDSPTMMSFSSNWSGAGWYLGLVEANTTNQANFVFQARTGASTTAERLRIDINGNVGIGVTNPTATIETPLSTTQPVFKSNTLVLQSFATNNLWFSDNIYYNGGWKYVANGAGSMLYHTGGDVQITNVPTNVGGAGASASPTIRLIVKAAGNVGIGSDSPTVKLDVSGSIRTGGPGLNGRILFTRSDGVNVGQIFNSGSTGLTLEQGGGGSFVSFNVGSGGLDGANPERLRVDGTTGHVGIGTASPGTRLHVSDTAAGGTVRFQLANISANGGPLRIGYFPDSAGFHLTANGNPAHTNNPSDTVSRDYTTRAAFEMLNILAPTLAASYLDFRYSSSTTFSPIVRFQGDGNVGVGTTTILARLHVSGSSTAADQTMLVRAGVTNQTGPVFEVENNAGTTLLIVSSSGNVGVGTGLPVSKFEVVGTSGSLLSVTDSLSGSLFSVNDITGVPILEVFSDDRVVAGAVNTNALVVTGSIVGIGTSLPQASLDVRGTANTYALLVSGSTTFGQSFGQIINAGSNSGDVTMRVRNYNGTSEYLFVRGDGNIGVGTASNFAGKLHVYGGNLYMDGTAGASSTATYSNSAYARLVFDNDYSDVARGPNRITLHDNAGTWIAGFGIHSNTVGYYSGATHAWYAMTSANPTLYMSLTSAGSLLPGSNNAQDIGSTSLYWRNLYVSNISGSFTGSNLTAGQVVVAGTGGVLSGSNNFWWSNSNGRVGIGTNNPASSLEVVSSSVGTNANLITIRNSAYNVGESSSLLFSHGTNQATSRISSYLPGSNQTNLTFHTSDTSSVLQQRMTIDGSGNVGINTTSMSLRLEVSGSDARIHDVRVGRGPGSLVSNTVVGNAAFTNNSTGTGNTAIGYFALNVSTGTGNTAVGDGSFGSVGSGAGVTGIGRWSGVYQTGNFNTALGAYSLQGVNGSSNAAQNTAVGYAAGQAVTTGGNNFFGGFQAGSSTTTGDNNVFIGYQAAYSNSVGQYNVYIGRLSGWTATSGSYNVLVGHSAGYSLTTAQSNTYIGHAAGYSSVGNGQNVHIGTNAGVYQTGAYNVSVGSAALNGSAGSSNASNNTALGYQAGTAVTTGGNNFFGGYQAGYSNSVATQNVFLGYASGYSITSGSNNVAVGYNAGYGETTGTQNVWIGSSAGQGQVAKSRNVVIGFNAGVNALLGNDNVIVGRAAVDNGYTDASVIIGVTAARNVTGNVNVAVGANALQGAVGSTSTASVAVGYQSLYSTTTSNNNTATGYQSGFSVTTGGSNTFVGYRAGFVNSVATNNTFVGNQSGVAVTSGSNNTFIGNIAGQSATTGANNTFLGYGAGNTTTTGNDNIYLGVNTTGSANNNTNETVIGFTATGRGSNTTTIGNGSITLTLIPSGSLALAGTAAGTNAVSLGLNNIASSAYTVALGYTNTASGNSSVAIGYSNSSTNQTTVALGESNTANAQRAIALGANNFSTGNYSVTLGQSNTSNTTNAVAIGRSNTSSGTDSFSLGAGNISSNTSSTAIGASNTASGYASVAGGFSNSASNFYSVALGAYNASSGFYSFAAGSTNTANGTSAVAMGQFSLASGAQAIAMGNASTGSFPGTIAIGSGSLASSTEAVALGAKNTASGPNAVSIGNNNTASFTGSIAIGAFNTASGQSAAAIGGSNIATGGYGFAAGYNSTASGFGSISMGGGGNVSNTAFAMSFGSTNTASGIAAAAIGRYSLASGAQAIAIGSYVTGSNTSAVAMGANSTASSPYAFAMGYNNAVGGQSSAAIGQAINITREYSAGFGANQTISGPQSITAGFNNLVSGGNSAAFGTFNTASGASSFVAGQYSLASGDQSVAIGSYVTGSSTSAVAIGGSNTASSNYSVAIGGSNTSSGAYSVVLGGVATGTQFGSVSIGYETQSTAGSAVAMGLRAKGYLYGQFSHSSGYFGTIGDSQFSTLVARNTTTNASATELFLNVASSSRLVLPASTTWDAEITVLARSAGGTDNASFKRRCVIKRDASNNTALVGPVQVVGSDIGSNVGSPPAGWGVTLSADDTNESLKIEVTGAVSTNIRWVAKIELTEVGYA